MNICSTRQCGCGSTPNKTTVPLFIVRFVFISLCVFGSLMCFYRYALRYSKFKSGISFPERLMPQVLCNIKPTLKGWSVLFLQCTCHALTEFHCFLFLKYEDLQGFFLVSCHCWWNIFSNLGNCKEHFSQFFFFFFFSRLTDHYKKKKIHLYVQNKTVLKHNVVHTGAHWDDNSGWGSNIGPGQCLHSLVHCLPPVTHLLLLDLQQHFSQLHHN